MATSDELLDILTTQPNPEGHIIVGGDRVIHVPDNLKRIGVEHDHNIETVTFDCPRYWDTHDLSQMAIYINYRLANGYTDRYPVEYIKVEADGDVMQFDWTISRNVTQVRGSVSFMVCAVKTEMQTVEGEEELVPVEVLHWNSELNQEMYVSEGMECEEVPVDIVSDIIAEMLKRYQTEEAVQQMREACMSAVEDCETLKNAASRANTQVQQQAAEIRNSYANAIKGNVSGEIVRVDDVSPLQHDVKCRVHGKNLFDGNLKTGYLADSTMQLTEVASTIYRTIQVYLTRGTYTFSSSTKLLILRMVQNGRYYNAGPTGTEYTFTVDTDGDFAISFRSEPSADWDDNILLQIERGPVATEYEPWINPTETSVMVLGKNFINHDLLPTSITNNGVTVTRSGDIITFSGTATADVVLANTAFCYYGKTGTNYVASYTYVGGRVNGSASLCIGDARSPAEARQSWANVTLTTNESRWYALPAIKDYIKDLWFYCKAGTQFTSFKLKVQLEEGTEATAYEPFCGVSHSPADDGTCTVRSVSPTMTLLTDTPGVIIEAEYNRDTTKMFESYVLTPEAKAEIAALVESDLAEVLSSLNDYAVSLAGGGA